MTNLVAGVDGCPGGWIAVIVRAGDPATAEARLCERFEDVLAIAPKPDCLAVDIPIGLPDTGEKGGRPCDREARARLGDRQSSVFSVPSRNAVYEEDYRRACMVALVTSDPPRKVSKQVFHLFPKIREVDALLCPDLQGVIVECHPELAFWALNDERPLGEPKKVKSRAYGPGLSLRRDLLTAAGFSRNFLEEAHHSRRLCGPDDLLDAAACAWSALRISKDAGKRFPEEPGRDRKGLRMEIWC